MNRKGLYGGFWFLAIIKIRIIPDDLMSIGGGLILLDLVKKIT